MMSTPFLSLVKEEPSDGENLGDRCRQIPLSVSHANPTLQAASMAGLPLNSPNMHHLARTDIDPSLEPVTRARSYTWPSCPEGLIDTDDMVKIETPLGDRRLPSGTPGSLAVLEPPGGTAKKNTSRRNPWGNMSYADLIAQAIVSSPEGRATLSQIYDWMVHNIAYFKDKGDSNSSAGWKNSIRHNLSLHSRFMRMQNEGTGKSSWWVLNPDAKPGKSTRRRANTLEGGGRYEKTSKRGRVKKKLEVLRNGIDTTPSPSSSLTEGADCFPDSPSMGSHHPAFQLSPQDYRPRASSNASSCGGRLSPIAAVDTDMHDSQVPPMSPNIAAWGSEYWATHGHPHGPHPLQLTQPHERYSDQLVESMGENLKLGTGENWGPTHLLPQQNSPDCLKLPSSGHAHIMNSHTHHINGFITHHHHHHHSHPGYSNFEEFGMFGPHLGGQTPHPAGFPNHTNHTNATQLEKINLPRHIQPPFQMPPLQSISPARNSHSLSPPNHLPESRFQTPNCDNDLRQTPSFGSSPPSHHHHQHHHPHAHPHPHPIPHPHTSANHTLHHSPPDHPTPTTSQQHATSSNNRLPNVSSCSVLSNSSHSQLVSTSSLQRITPSTSNHTQAHTHTHSQNQPETNSPPEATTMLKVSASALSHREASMEVNQSLPSTVKQGSGPNHNQSHNTTGGSNDLVDLDSIQEAPFDCNVDEVIKHELQYEDHFTFDFAQGQHAHNHSSGHSYYNRRESTSQITTGSPTVMQSYSRSSIAAGNQWVR